MRSSAPDSTLGRVVFHDLAGPQSPTTADDDRWLASLALEVDAQELTVNVGASMASHEPEPVLTRQLDGTWRAGRYIGELRRAGRVLEIRPRLGIETIARWVGAALNVRVVPATAEHRDTSALVAELMAAVWRAAVTDAARHGLPGFRTDTLHEGLFARGRIDVRRTLRIAASGRPGIASVDRPRTADNAATRAIVLADRVLDAHIERAYWRGERVAEVVTQMRSATGDRPRLPTARELRQVRYTPITLPYKRAAWLSWQIARRTGLRASATAEGAEGFLIDVAELWELFLVHCARKACGASVVTHGTRLSTAQRLLHSAEDQQHGLGRLYPDIVIGAADSPRAILDAKYKPLREPRGVDREDLYQLVSYLTSHSPSGDALGMLAYPLDAEPPQSRAETMSPWLTRQGHTVTFARVPTDEQGAVDHLREVLSA